MILTLRPYQSKLLEDTRAALRRSRSVVMQLPTGGGKTEIGAAMLGGVVQGGKAAHFIVHRQELIDQTAERFQGFGLPFGIIAAGYAPNPHQPIQICSVQTLSRRLQSGVAIPRAALVNWDECHHCAAPAWQQTMAYFSDAWHVGLTATPERLDGLGLAPTFGAMVCGPDLATLIAQGYLSRYRAFAPYSPDLHGAASKMGDYVRRDLRGLMDRPVITGDAITHYLRLARGKRAIAFCVSIEHSQNVARQFCEAGIEAAHFDGTTPRGERRAIMKAFRAGSIDVLTNADLIGEGVDVPDAVAAILLRPTKSLSLFRQQCGRVFRRAADKDHALILDHAGNLRRHGLPDDPHEWSLQGRKRRASDDREAPEPFICPECSTVHAPAKRCPGCGYVYERSLQPRQVEHVDGELLEVAGGEAARAQSVDELVKLGRERGYRDADDWAKKYWTAKTAADWRPLE